MIEPPKPADEVARVAALHATGLLDSGQEERFDRITRLVSAVLGVPGSLVTLVDAERQWFKSSVGLDESETPRSMSFCGHALVGGDEFVVTDATADARFHDNPLVTGPPRIRSYVGVPLALPGGERVGTLCAFDRRRRQWSPEQLAILHDLAGVAEAELARTDVEETGRRAAAEAAQWRSVVDGVDDAVIAVDASGRVRRANRSARTMLGRQDLENRTLHEVVREERPGQLARLIDEAIASGAAGPLLLSTPTRRRLHLLVRRMDGAAGPAAVVTAREVAGESPEGSVVALRIRYERILDAASDGICGLDAEGRIEYANLAASTALGYPRHALAGLHFHHLAHHTRADGMPCRWETCPMRRALSEGEAVRESADLMWRRDGSSFPVDYSVAPVWEGDAAVGAVIVFTDVSGRLGVERLKDEFVSVVSHELRTPLTSIRGSIGLLAAGAYGALPAGAQRMAEIAVSNTDRLTRLINDILDLERIDSGVIRLELHDVALREILAEALEMTEGVASAAAVDVVAEVDTMAQVRADRDRVVQVLTNLISNAVKFSPPEGSVRLGVGETEREVWVSVTDMGRGIPAEELERVFERFHQVQSSDNRELGGTGLGLAIARSIIVHHGGRIWAENAAHGGARFTFTLPKPGVTTNFNGSFPSARFRVLVAEDDPDVAEVLGGVLSSADVDVDVAIVRTEAQAVAAAAERVPDVAIVDLTLAEGDGFALVQRLRAAASTAIIVYTVVDLGLEERAGLGLASEDVFSKSRTAPEAVGRRVLELLGKSGAPS